MTNSQKLSYTYPVPKTNGTRGESRNFTRRTYRPLICLAVFLRLHASVRLLWAGTGGGAFGRAGPLVNRSLNLPCCPPTPFESGVRVLSHSQGGHHG